MNGVFGFVVTPLIWSSGLLRYGIKLMVKGVPAMTVWVGPAAEADGGGATLGVPEVGDPDPEDGNAFEVGITGGDTGEVPTSLAVGEMGGRDGVEGAAGLGVEDAALGGPLVGPTGGGEVELGSGGTPVVEPPDTGGAGG